MWRSGPAHSTIRALHPIPGVGLHEGASRAQLDRTERWLGFSLPTAHRQALAESNGIEAEWGFRRIIGLGEAVENIAVWNRTDCWKFTWPQPLDNFLCVAMTGLGDQFAYRIDAVRGGDERIFMLDAYQMEPNGTAVANSFEEFLARFAEQAKDPSPRFAEARRQVGDLRPDELATLTPSPLLVGLDRATQFARMSARLAMTINGDMATQLLDPAREGQAVARIDQERDERGWPRIHVVWVSPP
jgi:hypothetical protein